MNSASPLRIEGSSTICVGGEEKRGEKDGKTNEKEGGCNVLMYI